MQETAQRESVLNFQAPFFLTLCPALWVLFKPVVSSLKQIILVCTLVFPRARENWYYLCATILFSCRLSACSRLILLQSFPFRTAELLLLAAYFH